MEQWNEIYVTDMSGKQYFRTTASPMATESEIKNLSRKLPHCDFIDQQTARIVLNGSPLGQVEMSDDELLAALTV